MPKIELSEELFERLQKHAVPLVDTAETIIQRALDALESTKDVSDGSQSNSNAQATPRILKFEGSQAPDLSFTRVRRASIDERVLPLTSTNWNSILLTTIKQAVVYGFRGDQLSRRLLVNHVNGRKETAGYKYVPEIDMSIQGLDANGAWKATAYLASSVHMVIQVEFAWQDNAKAAFPGRIGRIEVM